MLVQQYFLPFLRFLRGTIYCWLQQVNFLFFHFPNTTAKLSSFSINFGYFSASESYPSIFTRCTFKMTQFVVVPSPHDYSKKSICFCFVRAQTNYHRVM